MIHFGGVFILSGGIDFGFAGFKVRAEKLPHGFQVFIAYAFQLSHERGVLLQGGGFQLGSVAGIGAAVLPQVGIAGASIG